MWKAAVLLGGILLAWVLPASLPAENVDHGIGVPNHGIGVPNHGIGVPTEGLSGSVPPDSTAGAVFGQVSGQEGAIPFAQVSVKGWPRVFQADAQGRFHLDQLPPGTHVLLVTALGYETLEETVEVKPGENAILGLRLKAAAMAMNPIVVTGTRRETFVSESAVKVDVVNASMLQRNVSDNLMETLGHINGLTTQVDCGVCFTNNIRINGMEGPYTAILIDGMPIMSALASVYGLNGINPAIIERLEIIKGPSSTLYGSEAMAGVVNVITKDPRFAPRYSLDLRAVDTGERTLDFSVNPGTPRLRSLLSGSVHHMDRFVDGNGNGFSDLPQAQRASLFGKLSWRPDGQERVGLAARYYYEDRFGGVREWTPAHRGSDEIYGESVFTNRAELFGSFRPAGLQTLRLEGSYVWHDQDSYYGDEHYAASQHVLYGTLLWDALSSRKHDLLAGLTVRHQVYDDNTPATPGPDRRFVPGVFLQDSYSPAWNVNLVGGMRLDHHGEHGFIASPRLSVRWNPTKDGNTTLRLNSGTGFRVVNVFSEDHAALTGAREVVFAEELKPERSWSVTGNVNQVLEFGRSPMMVDVDLFYTRFSNRIVPDYDVDPRLILYQNLRGEAVSRGVAVSFNQNFSRLPLLYSVGVTLQDVFIREGGVKESLVFSPEYTGSFMLSYAFPRGLTVDYTGSVMGPMRLPEFDPPFERPVRSGAYGLHNLQATLRVGQGREVYAAVRNLLDWKQESPLIDPANPFGDAFDTAYVYGPVYGRQFLVGFRLAGSR
jgi:outer membrane receptor for ferrienterochelin and colicins